MNRAPSRLEPLMERLCNNRAVLRSEGLTTWPHTGVYLSGDFILMFFGNIVKEKKTNFCRFPGKSDLVGRKFMYHQLPNVMIHTHAKFAPLDFTNKK